jgi:hypothetical protein
MSAELHFLSYLFLLHLLLTLHYLLFHFISELNNKYSAASMRNLNGEFEVEVVTPKCTEYNESLVQLQALLDANKPNLSTLANIMTKFSQSSETCRAVENRCTQ